MEHTIFDLPLVQWSIVQYFEFIITYLIPIVGCLALVAGGIWTIYKYFREKNKEFYSHILNNVYAPLFEELIKMEYSRKLLFDSEAKNKNVKKDFSVKIVPFILWNGARQSFKSGEGKVSLSQEEYPVFNFDTKLKEICDSEERLQYAPRDLVALIKSYFFLEQLKGENYLRDKTNLQIKIRRNVIIGYKKYRKKLGLRDVSVWKFCYSFWGWIFFR